MKRSCRLILGFLLVFSLFILPLAGLVEACGDVSVKGTPRLKVSINASSLDRDALAEQLYDQVYGQLKQQLGSRYMERTVKQIVQRVVDSLLPQLEERIPSVPQQPAPDPDPAPNPPVPEPEPEPEEPEPEPPADPSFSLSRDEQVMLNLVNQERSKAGLNTLQIHEELTRVARLKAEDMVKNNYFAHNSPVYGSPFQMMTRFGISYSYAGENLAGAYSVERAHSSLMNSPGHRANILNTNFTHVGIGVVDGGPYGKIFVQMFMRPR